MGSPRVVIDPDRDVAVWRWDLSGEAFGDSPPNQDPDGDGNAFVLDLRYPGQRYDSASGLNENHHRDYDPTTGRYAQSDPIGLDGGVSTYGYANASPLVYNDPEGLFAGLVMRLGVRYVLPRLGLQTAKRFLPATRRRVLSKLDEIPLTRIAGLDRSAIQCSSFSQKINAMRRAGFDVVENSSFTLARAQFEGMKFTYNPATMTRLDFAHEWRHFRQLSQMIEKGLSPLKSGNMRIANAPAERGAYLYEQRIWERIGASPSSEYLQFHAEQVGFFEARMYEFRRIAARPYNAIWRGITW